MGILDEVGVGIDTQAFVVEHLAVGTLTTADKEDEVVARGELRDVRHTVGDGAADGVEALKGGGGRDVRLDVVDDAVVLVERLRGLGIEIDVTREVKTLHLVEILDDDGGGVGLSHETQHLGMTFLTEDDDLGIGLNGLTRTLRISIVLLFDAFLELEHHRTGGVDDLDVVAAGEFVGLRGLAVGTEEHLHVVEFTHVCHSE